MLSGLNFFITYAICQKKKVPKSLKYFFPVHIQYVLILQLCHRHLPNDNFFSKIQFAGIVLHRHRSHAITSVMEEPQRGAIATAHARQRFFLSENDLYTALHLVHACEAQQCA